LAVRGSVAIDGGSAGDPIECRRHVGALLVDKGLYPRLAAREKVSYFGELRGFTGHDLSRRVHRALAAVGVESLADRPIQGFSQGERMKVALARAMVHEPKHLILDEPMNGLDVPSTRAFKSVCRECAISACASCSRVISLRDRRSLMSAALYSLMGPVVILLVARSAAAAEGGAPLLLSMMSVFALVSAFTGGMYLALDATAGERERGSLVPLMLNPIPALRLIAGKWSARRLVRGDVRCWQPPAMWYRRRRLQESKNLTALKRAG
jgi:hypothetical protein